MGLAPRERRADALAELARELQAAGHLRGPHRHPGRDVRLVAPRRASTSWIRVRTTSRPRSAPSSRATRRRDSAARSCTTSPTARPPDSRARRSASRHRPSGTARHTAPRSWACWRARPGGAGKTATSRSCRWRCRSTARGRVVMADRPPRGAPRDCDRRRRAGRAVRPERIPPHHHVAAQAARPLRPRGTGRPLGKGVRSGLREGRRREARVGRHREHQRRFGLPVRGHRSRNRRALPRGVPAAAPRRPARPAGHGPGHRPGGHCGCGEDRRRVGGGEPSHCPRRRRAYRGDGTRLKLRGRVLFRGGLVGARRGGRPTRRPRRRRAVVARRLRDPRARPAPGCREGAVPEPSPAQPRAQRIARAPPFASGPRREPRGHSLRAIGGRKLAPAPARPSTPRPSTPRRAP